MSTSIKTPTAPGFQPATRVRGFGTTVFTEFTALALQHNAVNLGQGFPNFPAPDFVKEAAQQAIAGDLNQYARAAGHPRLIKALAQVYSPLFGRELNPLSEIVVTVGATEGIFATIQALVEPGDEVILIEPFYDSYPASVIMAGGTPVYVPLRPQPNAASSAEWMLDMDELAAAFSPRTKLLVINTPQNPVGKVFSVEELTQIAELVQRNNTLVLSDEVYEWMVYTHSAVEKSRGGDPLDAAAAQGYSAAEIDAAAQGYSAREVAHVRIATLPGMWERTITLGSAGKTFSVTGWKIGWAIAPATIAQAIFAAHQWIPFAVSTPMQEAVAVALEQVAERDYFNWLSTMYQQKRDKLLGALNEVGLRPMSPDGSYFILVDTGHLDVPTEQGYRRDYSVCRWFTREVGVAAIPPSTFYSAGHAHLTDNLARFCFCKTDEMLDEAAKRLRKIGIRN